MRSLTLSFLSLVTLVRSDEWPYNRVRGVPTHNGKFKPDPTQPEFGMNGPKNHLGEWLHGIIKQDSTGQLKDIFIDGSVSTSLLKFCIL